MKAKLNFKGKIIEIPNVEKVSGIGKLKGLIFAKKETNALLFEFSKPVNISIHSFFCPDFLAIWLNEGKIVEYKLINSWKFSIKPEKEFTKLLEIPVNERYRNIVELFLVGERKI